MDFQMNLSSTVNHLEIFESYRPLLFSIAYRMVGSVMEAEDIVQETYLRYAATPLRTIESPKAFLSTITTRLCLDHLKSARVQREQYVGPWLPEPLLTDGGGPQVVNKYEQISMAAMVLLESLSPVERAVFLLRAVFDYDYHEIAQIVEKGEANCRQYYRRAKQHLNQNKPRFNPTPGNQKKLIVGLVEAITQGDLDKLTAILADDVTLWSDGGGKVAAAPRPLFGPEIVARLFSVSSGKLPPDARTEFSEVNGTPALLMWFGEQLITVLTVEGDEEQIHEIRMVWNPDKLQHIQKLRG